MIIHTILAIWPYPFRILEHTWWPESGQGYAFFSSVGGTPLFAVGTLGVVWRKINCHEAGCFRVGRHHVEGTPYVTCHKHHPALKGGKVQAGHIKAAHQAHIDRNS